MAISLNKVGINLNRSERLLVNENWTTIENELEKAKGGSELAELAKLAADDAQAKADSVRQELNEVVVSGDSGPQAAQASVGADGTSYDGNLKARLDAEHNKVTAQLDEKVGGGKKAAPEDFDERSIALMTGQGTVNLLSVPQNNSVTPEKLTADTVRYVTKSDLSNMLDNSNVPASVNPVIGNIVHIHPSGDLKIFSNYSSSYQVLNVVQGHKYYVRFKFKSDSVGDFRQIRLIYPDNTYTQNTKITHNYALSDIITAEKTGSANIAFRATKAGLINRENQLVVDLTQIFRAGHEPSLEEFEKMLTYFEYEWFDKIVSYNELQRASISRNVEFEREVQDKTTTNTMGNILKKSNVPASVNSVSGDWVHVNEQGLLSVFSGYTDLGQVFSVVEGHCYYIKLTLEQGDVNNARFFYSDSTQVTASTIKVGEKRDCILIANKTGNVNVAFQSSYNGEIKKQNMMVVDLTKNFGAGNEPTVEDFRVILSNFENSWFDSRVNISEFQKMLFKDIIDLKKTNLNPNPIPYPSSNLSVISKTANKVPLWYDDIRKVLYAVDQGTPVSKTTLYASGDYGKTYNIIYQSTSGGIAAFKTLKSGYHIIKTSNSRLERVSPDFSSKVTSFERYVASPLSSSLGIAESNGVVMYAEYGTTSGATYNIWRSLDDGLTWEEALSGNDVRHWHSVQVDPYTGYFWAAGGDSGHECRIVMSDDGGDTWTVMSSGLQQDRAVGLVFYEDEIIWAMDTAGEIPYVMKSNKTNWSPVIVGEVPHRATTLGVSKTIDGLTMGWTRVENNSKQREFCGLWVSDGKVVKEILKLSVTPENVIGSGQFGVGAHATMINDDNIWFGLAEGTVLNGVLSIMLPMGI